MWYALGNISNADKSRLDKNGCLCSFCYLLGTQLIAVTSVLVAVIVGEKLEVTFSINDFGSIQKRDLGVNTFVAIGRQRGGHFSCERAVAAVKLLNWEDVFAQKAVSIGDHIMWPSVLSRLAKIFHFG